MSYFEVSYFEYECEQCHVVTEAERMSWPDLCDRCHWRANLGANFAAAGMAAVLHRILIRACLNGDCDCSSGRMRRTMREAVS